ncbi:MAG: MBL fold metallo-hydrolase [Candidatus Omnitrophica bacterium]|nr:MBL fold metallo-hydrolase [Candidatus Omnitrophota bacterium]MBU4488586.1 MBL fold metallo-hydrolase [Candidatus Omnitrophota bacterium]MCG2704466.1 MBL fold metallo-hydrolase [Candidatus Omnitrophota bacterium]
MFIKRVVVGALETNCYILADPQTREAAIIDPGSDGNGIKREIERHGFNIKCVINTHGHGDHISSNGKFKAPIYIHRLDVDFLRNSKLNMSASFGFSIKSPEASRILEEGDIIEIGSCGLKVIHTPGHTPGSISLLGRGFVFTGDTLFMGGVGRTDFPYGSEKKLIDSIREKLLVLDDNTIVYPGHGPSSTIGAEKLHNGFVNASVT